MRTEFQWLTSIRITKESAEKTAEEGRKRWKIENEGFNRQKNWQGNKKEAKKKKGDIVAMRCG